jgi:hypothetical protein
VRQSAAAPGDIKSAGGPAQSTTWRPIHRFRKRDLLVLAIAAALVVPAGAPGGTEPAPASTRCYVITGYGAAGDGRTLNTRAIQDVIDRCAAGGGGVVVVPRGTFITGSIFLKPGVNLRIEKDGVLKGSQNTNDYPWIDTRIA